MLYGIWTCQIRLITYFSSELHSLVGQLRSLSTPMYWSLYTGMTENSYWASRFTRGSEAQLSSTMAMFLLHLNVDSIPEILDPPLGSYDNIPWTCTINVTLYGIIPEKISKSILLYFKAPFDNRIFSCTPSIISFSVYSCNFSVNYTHAGAQRAQLAFQVYAYPM